MRILMLTQVLPFPPDSGPRVKTWNVLRHLAARHEVTVVSFVRPSEARHVSALRAHCRDVVPVPLTRDPWREGAAAGRSLLFGTPWLIARDERRAMRTLVRRIGSGYDVVHADQLGMCSYALDVPAPRRIFDAHTAVFPVVVQAAARASGARRWLLAREAARLRRYEGEMCRRFDVVTAVSEPDAAAYRDATEGRARIHVVPCSVDTAATPATLASRTGDGVMHVGTMFWPPNVEGIAWFLDEIWPHVKRRRPGASFTGVGARPPARLQRQAQRLPDVRLTGYVDDTTSIFDTSAVFVVPLKTGTGMRLKILEAFARGVPVVSTSLGCEGIHAVDGRHLLVADTAARFADHVVALLENPALGETLARNARQLVTSTYDCRVVLTALDALYEPA